MEDQENSLRDFIGEKLHRQRRFVLKKGSSSAIQQKDQEDGQSQGLIFLLYLFIKLYEVVLTWVTFFTARLNI